MSLESHLTELRKKHGDLERQIEELKAAPSSDDSEIMRLKRRKLALKDEMSRLAQPTRH